MSTTRRGEQELLALGAPTRRPRGPADDITSDAPQMPVTAPKLRGRGVKLGRDEFQAAVTQGFAEVAAQMKSQGQAGVEAGEVIAPLELTAAELSVLLRSFPVATVHLLLS